MARKGSVGMRLGKHRWVSALAWVTVFSVTTLFVMVRAFPQVKPSPRVGIDQALGYDFGAANTQHVGRHSWTIRNTGLADLELWLEKKPQCGCTVTSLKEGEKQRIEPGKSLNIDLEWRCGPNWC
jgi:hypothetical protein